MFGDMCRGDGTQDTDSNKGRTGRLFYDFFLDLSMIVFVFLGKLEGLIYKGSTRTLDSYKGFTIFVFLEKL